MNTDTPRTDAEAEKHRVYDYAINDYADIAIVRADFARQLERELAAVQSELCSWTNGFEMSLPDLYEKAKAERDAARAELAALRAELKDASMKGMAVALKASQADFDDLHAQIDEIGVTGQRDGSIQAKINALANERDQLRAENERLRADGVRLDWLVNNVNGGFTWGDPWLIGYTTEFTRAAIDSAMSGKAVKP